MTPARSYLLLILILLPISAHAGPSTPARTAQVTQTPAEPPLADSAVPPPVLAPMAPGVEGSLAPVDPPTPRVSIRVRVPATAAPGQDLEYRFCVHNSSQAPAHHVTIRCARPATSSSWVITTIVRPWACSSSSSASTS